MVLVQMAFSSHKFCPLAHSSCSGGEIERETPQSEYLCVCVCLLCERWRGRWKNPFFLSWAAMVTPLMRGHVNKLVGWEYEATAELFFCQQPAFWIHVSKHQFCLASSKWIWSQFCNMKVPSNNDKGIAAFSSPVLFDHYRMVEVLGATADTCQGVLTDCSVSAWISLMMLA